MVICKKIAAVLLFSLLAVSSVFAQQEEPSENSVAPENKTEDSQSFKVSTWDFFFTMTPTLYVNSDNHSAPNPVYFGLGAGFDFFNNYPVNLQPKLTIFNGYYLWDGEIARPAEVENRTAQVIYLLFDLDASHTWIKGKNAIQAGAGISVLSRFGFLANGVDDDQSKDEVNKINSWFFSDLNFLYPNIAVSWMRQLESKWHAGFESRLYIPIGALTSGRGVDTLMLSLGIKVCSK